jgi:hypothetical protein
MPDANNHVFSHAELAELLIKRLDLHDGLWGVYLEFGLIGANVPLPPDGEQFMPAAVCTVNKIGLQRFDKSSNLTVDAAVVNPRDKPIVAKKKARPR